MARIFISYSRSDESTVDELVKQLEAAGHSVWIDREAIRGGEQWRERIVEAIDKLDVLLLILSSSSVGSDNVRTEIDLAKESSKKVIPVEIQPVKIPSSMRFQLAGLQHINLYEDPESGFQELLEALGETQETGPKPFGSLPDDSKQFELSLQERFINAVPGERRIITLTLYNPGHSIKYLKLTPSYVAASWLLNDPGSIQVLAGEKKPSILRCKYRKVHRVGRVITH